MSKIMPCLWFDGRIEEAANFYTSVFPDAKITNLAHYDDAGPMPKGTLLTVTFEIAGQEFMILNGGAYFKINEGVSFYVHCKDQAEVDHYWGKLSAVPQAEQCGWLKDKFGVSWQIVPDALVRYVGDKDPVKANRVMQAMLQMKKIVIADLDKAYAG
ncbi:MAG: VOC family protein [Bauldia sp.]